MAQNELGIQSLLSYFHNKVNLESDKLYILEKNPFDQPIHELLCIFKLLFLESKIFGFRR